MKTLIRSFLVINAMYFGLTACSIIQALGPKSAHVSSYLPGMSHDILMDTVREIEISSGEPFLSEARSHFVITVEYGDLDDHTLGQAFTNRRSFCIIKINNKINPERNIGYSPFDLQAILTHEIGHCFGLAHNPNPSSIMYWSYDRNQNSPNSFMDFINDLKKIRGVKN